MKHPGKDFLSKREKELLISQHSCEHEKKYADRVKSIILLNEGWSYEQIAKVLLIDHKTIRRNYAIYITEGIDILLTMNYSGKTSLLSLSQQKELQVHLENNIYMASSEISEYVKKRYQIKYSTKGMTAFLHRLGFIYKKPKLVPGKANKESQQAFIEKYKELKRNLNLDDKILFMDGVHPQHNSKPAYGWFRKGKKAQIRSNTGRKRININGVLDAENSEVIVHEDEAINAQSTIKLLKKVEEKYLKANTITIICDNARYYRSKLLFEYIKSSKINLEFLPPYAPNLNLIERLWRFMNKKVRDNKYYESFDIFKNTILKFFDNIKIYKKDLESLLVDDFEIIDSQTQVH